MAFVNRMSTTELVLLFITICGVVALVFRHKQFVVRLSVLFLALSMRVTHYMLFRTSLPRGFCGAFDLILLLAFAEGNWRAGVRFCRSVGGGVPFRLDEDQYSLYPPNQYTGVEPTSAVCP